MGEKLSSSSPSTESSSECDESSSEGIQASSESGRGPAGIWGLWNGPGHRHGEQTRAFRHRSSSHPAMYGSGEISSDRYIKGIRGWAMEG